MLTRKILSGALLTLLCGLLSACYITPGQFDAELHIAADGGFTYRYVGEIVYLKAGERPMEPWDNRNARCFDEDGGSATRPCTQAEIERQRAEYEAASQKQQKDIEAITRLTGFNFFDDNANHRIAERLMTQRGWKRAVYKGKGIFAVEYEMKGNVERDFAFPSLPTAQMLVPFVTVYPSKSGLIRIEAPGMTGGVMRRVINADNDGIQRFPDAETLFQRVNGTLKITTGARLVDTNGTQSQSGESSLAKWAVKSGEVEGMNGSAPFAEIQLP